MRRSCLVLVLVLVLEKSGKVAERLKI